MKNINSMKKKLAIVFVFTLVFSIFMIPASAAAPSVEAVTVTASEEISEAEAQMLYYLVDAANDAIVLAVRIAQLTPYNDVPVLLKTVDAIAGAVFDYAESIGAEVACEYTPYEIDGQTVLIDPIRVVNIPVGAGGTGGGRA